MHSSGLFVAMEFWMVTDWIPEKIWCSRLMLVSNFLLNSVKKLYATIFLDRIRISVGTSGVGQHSRGIFHVGEVVVSEENRSAIGELSKYLHLFKQKLSGNESTPVFNILPLIIKMHWYMVTGTCAVIHYSRCSVYQWFQIPLSQWRIGLCLSLNNWLHTFSCWGKMFHSYTLSLRVLAFMGNLSWPTCYSNKSWAWRIGSV